MLELMSPVFTGVRRDIGTYWVSLGYEDANTV